MSSRILCSNVTRDKPGPGGELAELPAETTDFGHGQAMGLVVD